MPSDEETPRDYDREYTRNLPGPIQIRVGRDTTHGDVTRFVVQLEYTMQTRGDQSFATTTTPTPSTATT